MQTVMIGGEVEPGLGRNVWSISFSVGVVVIALFTWSRLLPLILIEMGATSVQVGIAYTLINLAMTVSQIPAGILADRVGRKLVIVVPSYVLAGLYILAGHAPTWQAMVGYLVLINIVGAAQSPAFVAIMAESVSPTRRGLAFAIMQFCIGVSVAIGPAVGALLAPGVDWRTLIVATGWTFLAIAIVRHITLRETHPAGKRTERWRPTVSWKLIRLLLIGSLFVSICTLTIWGPFISLFAADVQSLGDRGINILFAIGALVSVWFGLVGGRSCDRFGPERVLTVCTGVHVLTCLVWMTTRSLWASAFWLAVAFSSLQAGAVAWDTLRSTVVEGHGRGTAIGIVGSVTAGVAGLAPATGGALVPVLGPGAPFILAAVLGAGLIALTGRALLPRPSRQGEGHALIAARSEVR